MRMWSGEKGDKEKKIDRGGMKQRERLEVCYQHD